MHSYFFIDPMSYNNLGDYDYFLLSNLKQTKVSFYCNKRFDHPEIDDISYYKIFNYQDKNRFLKAFSYSLSLLYLLLKIIKYKPPILHFQWFKLFFIDLIFLQILKIFNSKIKIVFTAHNVLPHKHNKMTKLIFKHIYRKIDMIIVHENYAKNKIINEFSIHHDKITIIRHGYFPNIKSGDKINNDKLVFGMVGYLSYYKGVDILYNAWKNSKTLNSEKSIKLILAGKLDPKVLNKINSTCKPDNIETYYGFLSEDEFQKIFDEIDILILPYREISQSGILLRAIGAKKPFIVTNKGGLSEPLDYGCVGWLLKDNSFNTIQDLLKNIAKNKSEFLARKESPDWTLVQANYDWVKIGLELQNMYVSLTN